MLFLSFVALAAVPLGASEPVSLREATDAVFLLPGVALGTTQFGSQGTHELLYFNAGYGRAFAGVGEPSDWWSGHWMAAAELSLAHQFRGESGGWVGVVPTVRYVASGRPGFQPYLLAGLGFHVVDIGRDLTGSFQFSPQGGLGVYGPRVGRFSVTAEYRFVHLSNGGIQAPNGGVNLHCFSLGLTRFIRP